MKKLFCSVALGITMLVSNTPAFAAPPLAPVLPVQQNAVYSIIINGKDMGQISTNIDGIIMVPIRSISEELGFTVTWSEESNTVHLENDTRASDVIIGNSKYSSYSTKSLGMTGLVDLGAPAMIISDKTYVPVEYFRILLANAENAVVIEDGKVSISSDIGEKNQIANPFTSCDTVEEAIETVGFPFSAPQSLPGGFHQSAISVMRDGSLAQVIYKKGDSEITYRISKTTGDISGDYNQYQTSEVTVIDGISINIRHNNGTVYVAYFENEGVNHCLNMRDGSSLDEINALVMSIK